MAFARFNKSITLIELLIAIILFSAVVLSFYSIDLFSRRQLLNSERQAKLQNEVSALITHISKNIQKAVGSRLNFPVNIDNSAPGGPRMTVYLDADDDGFADTLAAYQWNTANYEVRYYSNYSVNPGSYEVIAAKIKSCVMSAAAALNYVELNIVSCWQPGQNPAYNTNPCVTMVTRVTMPAVSVN